MLDYAWHTETAHFCKCTTSSTDVVSVRMSGIPLRRYSNAPAFVRRQRFGTIVIIFALRVHQFAKSSRAVDLSHSVDVVMKGRCFKHHVLAPTLLHGL